MSTPIGASGPAPGRVLVSTFPQDPAVGPARTDSIPPDQLGDRLEGPRVGVYDPGKLRAYPDKNGNYLFRPEQPQFDQVQSFNTAQKTLDLFERLADEDLPWAFESPQLGVVPHAGEGANAYYVRWQEAVSFYFFDSRELGKTVQTAQSTDVVAHETGHAVLDGLKPEWLSEWDGQTKAFHEAFGDCAAMLLALERPEVVEHVLQETGGDLTRDNAVSRIAEEFGTAVRRANHDPGDDRPYLRNANNAYLYQPPEGLPADGPRDTLTREPHSFANVFTGSFYRCLTALAGSPATPSSLAEAGQKLGRLLARAVATAAPSGTDFPEIARGMLAADQELYAGAGQTALRQVMLERKLLSRQDLEDFDRARAALPNLRLSQAPLDGRQALAFLEANAAALGVPPGHYARASVRRDRAGRVRLEFLRSQSFELRPGLAGEVRGGLTLGFDENGRLRSLSCQEVTPERLSRARQAARALRADQMAWEGEPGPTHRVRVVADGAGGHRLEPLPVCRD